MANRTQKRFDKNSINAIWMMPRAEISDVVVAEIVPVLVAEMVPVLVAEMVPVPVAEMVPVPVAEIVPVFVAEIVPDLANVVAENVTTNMPAKAIDLTFFIVFAPASFNIRGDMVGFEVRVPSHTFEPTYYKNSILSFSRNVPMILK
jgi:hypothetical protein